MRSERVIVVGAGVGGLVAALGLAQRGFDVIVVERAAAPGGKMREVPAGPVRLDGGPTVFTMRWVFEEVFADAGTSLAAELPLQSVRILARHGWADGSRLDLHADRTAAADAIAAFAGAREAAGYLAFCARARGIYDTLQDSFIRAERPSPVSLTRRVGITHVGELWRISPFTTLWKALGEHFQDARLRQLFGRYATYCGSNPFDSPATLMLVAHVEQEGVWLVEGGMHRIAQTLARLAAARGATIRYESEAREVLAHGGRAAGIVLASGEQIAADAVILNADAGAIAGGLFGAAAAKGVPKTAPAERSLSAVTWHLQAVPSGFPLLRHTVFFSRDYKREFDDIFARGRLPAEPTVYVCAQDRGDDDRGDDDSAPTGPERLMLLVNAPAVGDMRRIAPAEIETCASEAMAVMARAGLRIAMRPEATSLTGPNEFEALFPATGGALYGRASHGWMASFKRAGARTALPGLYLAGGSVHPGPGVPMAALSGRIAVQSLLADRASIPRSRPAAMPGGTSTR